MKSMTGFGSASVENKNFRLEISVKSVNSRFLDIKYYIPSFYSSLEPGIQKLIFQKGRRGHFIVRMDRFPSRPVPSLVLRWDRGQAEKWKSLYQKASREMEARKAAGGAISIDRLMEKEGVVNVIEQPEPLSAREGQIVRAAFKKALQSCLRERIREGESLKKDILSQTRSLQSVMKKIRILSKKQNKRQSQKRSRQNPPLKESQSAFRREDLFEGDKYDMNEEIIRVEEHLRHFQKIAREARPVGKKLEFYTQELVRELNTIASKSQMGELTFQAVEGKAAVERIKEQAQNIE